MKNLTESLKTLREIKDIAFATVDAGGNPQVRIIDVMMADEDALYFCTARGKDFYLELISSGKVAAVALTKDWEMIRLSGRAVRLDEQKEWIDKIFENNPAMLAILPAAPNGGNKMQVRYAVVDDRDKMKAIKERVYNAMLENAAAGRYPDGFDKSSFDDFMRDAGLGEGKTDIVFRGAPHMFIAHSPQGKGTWVQDVNIASTYFDLLCTSRGLGSIMMTFPLGALRATPGLLEELGIPEDHYIAMVVGFGKPMYLYTRGVQKDMEE